MENNFKKMYIIMGIIGELIGIGGIIFAVTKNILTDLKFSILLVALLVMLIAVRIMAIAKSKGCFQNINEFTSAIAKGHLSMMLGVCTLITSVMFANAQPFADTFAIVIIVILFMSVMLGFMIKTFTNLMDMVKESEKK